MKTKTLSIYILLSLTILSQFVFAQSAKTTLPTRNATIELNNSKNRKAVQYPDRIIHNESILNTVTSDENDIPFMEMVIVELDQFPKINPTPKDVLLDEGFENWPPANWEYYEAGVSSPGWQQSASQPHAGDYCALHGYFAGGIHDNWMVSPQLTIDQTYNLNFWDKLTSYNYYEYSGVSISTVSGDPASGDFVEIYNADDAIANVWTEHIYDLTPYIGENIYIAFQYSGNNAHRWNVDDVSVIPLTYTDGGITTITNPPVGTTTTGGSVEDVKIILENFGTDIIENADFEWMVNSVPQTTYSAANLSLEQGSNIELIIGQYDFSQYTDYDISISCIISGDQNISNDTKTGTYSVEDLGNAGVIGISPNGQSGVAYLQDVSVIIKNFGVQVLESVEIEWEVDDVPQIPFIASNLGLAPGTSTERIIGQFDFSNPGYYQIFAGTNLPVDYVPANDTMSVGFASAMLRESFEGPHNDFWPPDHWEMKYATYMTDFPYDGNYMGMILSGGNEWGVSDGWLTTPLLDISPGDVFSFQLRTDGLTGGGFSIHWQDGETGDLNLIQNISTPEPFAWNEININISAASGVNRIVLKESSTTYNDAFLDLIKCTAPVYTFDYDLEVLRFEHNLTPNTNTQDTIKCNIRNYTANIVDAGSYTVKLMEEPGIELGTLTGLALAPMQSEIFEFYHTFADEDQHNLYIEVEYAEDQNPDDNVSNIASLYPVPGTTVSHETGENDLGNLNIPFDTFGTEGLGQDDFTQIIYHFEEVGSMGYIYGLKFHYNLHGLMYGQTLPLKLWIGETLNNDLTGGWEPHENMTLVFDSLIITKNYLNEMFIPFDEPYLFTGGNLVVQTIQYDPEFMASWTSFHCTETPGELRTAKSPDWYEIDPENPPSFEFETQHWEQLPDATFIINPFEDLAEVSGTVYNENSEPLNNVLMELAGTAVNTFTDSQGNFSFPTVPFGDWTFKASYLGYEDNLQTITVDETAEILDFSMIPKPLITVSGYIEGTDQLGMPLEGVSIEITGYSEYNGMTNSNGIFSIPDIFGNADYELMVSKFGYEPYSTTFSVTNENIDFGTIILQERVISAFDVSALENPDDFISEIYWPDPLTGMEDTLQFDWGVEDYGLANEPFENVWLGNFMANDEVITITSITVFFINNPQTSGEVSLDIFDMDENLLVSSEKFFTQNQSYLTIDFPNLTYDGDLYIMLHWEDNPATTNMLGIDFSIGIPDLCYIHYPGQGFQLLSDYLGTGPGVALIRANVIKASENKKAPKNKAVLSYNIFRGQSEDLYNIENWTQVNTNPVTDLNYIDEDWLFTEPNNYRYAVETVYVEGSAEVTYSNVLSIDYITPSNPNIDIDPISGEILFSWDSPEHNVQSYNIYLDDLNNPVSIGVTELSFVYTDVTNGMHTVGVQAVYNTGASSILTEEFVITKVSTFIKEDICIYPNPANDIINIKNANGSEIYILDLTGSEQMYIKCENDNQQVSISSLRPGIYLLKILNDGKTINRKLEVSK